MNRTGTEEKRDLTRIAVSTEGLMQILSCGYASAVKIGSDAGARIQIGRRVIWNVKKVQDYLDRVAE